MRGLLPLLLPPGPEPASVSGMAAPQALPLPLRLRPRLRPAVGLAVPSILRAGSDRSLSIRCHVVVNLERAMGVGVGRQPRSGTTPAARTGGSLQLPTEDTCAYAIGCVRARNWAKGGLESFVAMRAAHQGLVLRCSPLLARRRRRGCWGLLAWRDLGLHWAGIRLKMHTPTSSSIKARPRVDHLIDRSGWFIQQFIQTPNPRRRLRLRCRVRI